jgi:hypothetical protein
LLALRGTHSCSERSNVFQSRTKAKCHLPNNPAAASYQAKADPLPETDGAHVGDRRTSPEKTLVGRGRNVPHAARKSLLWAMLSTERNNPPTWSTANASILIHIVSDRHRSIALVCAAAGGSGAGAFNTRVEQTPRRRYVDIARIQPNSATELAHRC